MIGLKQTIYKWTTVISEWFILTFYTVGLSYFQESYTVVLSGNMANTNETKSVCDKMKFMKFYTISFFFSEMS